MARYPHLVMRNLGKASENFEPHLGRDNTTLTPVQNRFLHAQGLRENLDDIAAAMKDLAKQQASMGVPKTKRGITVAIESREDQELIPGARRANSPGMQMLSLQRGKGANKNRHSDLGLFFITETSAKTLGANLDVYGAWSEPSFEALLGGDEEPGRPRNMKFFESMAEMRVATIEDLWTDSLGNFPRERGAVEWEVWIRSPLADAFARAVTQLGLEVRGRPTKFVDIEVHNLVATRRQLSSLISASAAVVELRGASDFIAEHAELTPAQRVAQVSGIADRIVAAPMAAPWITLLDTGANSANPLLTSSLPAQRCHTVMSQWNAQDADGHGSKMAGVGLFGDIGNVATTREPIQLDVGLESIVIFSPSSAVRIPARDAMMRAVDQLEGTAQHPRVYCLAATAVGEAEDGRPTATSAAIDQLAFGDGVAPRLFCVAVGNVTTSGADPYQIRYYEALNEEYGIQSPAQALNVLSVGACTHKCSGPTPLAGAGDLSPRSRTAQLWEFRAHKPDIVMEGGNHSIDPGGDTSRPHVPDMVLTTSNQPQQRPITYTGDTSAACAAAARLAGRLMARYPALRPETVRALLVHNAEWTDTMLARRKAWKRAGMSEEQSWRALLSCFGWGVPNEDRVFASAENALTLIAEDSIMPYKRSSSSVTLREMKWFSLPWPQAALKALRATEVELRCTLSYFIDPDPHSAALERWQMYHSHGLRFNFQRFGESESSLLSRSNRAIDASERDQADDNGWLLGSLGRRRGTLHHDIWRGPAYQLADRNAISVSPIRGWWVNEKTKSPETRPLNFTLIASIRTPTVTSDLMAEVLTKVPANVRIEVPGIVQV